MEEKGKGRRREGEGEKEDGGGEEGGRRWEEQRAVADGAFKRHPRSAATPASTAKLTVASPKRELSTVSAEANSVGKRRQRQSVADHRSVGRSVKGWRHRMMAVVARVRNDRDGKDERW